MVFQIAKHNLELSKKKNRPALTSARAAIMDLCDDTHFPWEGSHTIVASKRKAKDFNGKNLNLFNGTYKMVETTVDVMIRKGTNMRLESYEFLSDFKHGNAVVLLDYTVRKQGEFHRHTS